MWLPTNALSSRNALWAAFALLAVLLLGLSSCGYHLGADSPSIFKNSSKTLKIKGVDYPTLQQWLPFTIRSALRDEVTARHLVQWVDSGPADYEIQLRVDSYTTREWMRDEIDTITQLYDASMGIEAIVYDGSTNKELWRSGIVYYSERLRDPNEQLAAGELVTQIVRRIVDRMRNKF